MKNRPENPAPFYHELRQAYEEIAASTQAPVAKLGLFATRSLQLFQAHQQRFERDPAGMFAVLTENRGCWFTSSARLFTETISDGIREGKIRNIDTQKNGTLLLGAIFALMIRRTHLPVSNPIEDDVRDLIDLYLNGATAARLPAPVGPPGSEG